MKFNQILNTLNTEQRQAVEQIYGPVLVLAGPGTGKTHLLTARIAHILNSDTGANAENILCLTFTENAAVEMKKRLQKWIGTLAYRVKIATFHGFCEWVMKENPAIFYVKIGQLEIADDLQKALIFRESIRTKKWKYFSNIWDEFSHQGDFLKAVSDLKRENLLPETLPKLLPAERARQETDPENFYQKKFREFSPGDWKPQRKQRIEDRMEKMAEFCDLWKIYEKNLRKHGFYDFDDLIHLVVTELQQNKNLRLDLQERFQWILVDEYQDTNNAQNAILWELTEGIESPNLFAVGDDDQSIYRFQGASVENIHTFRQKFLDRLEVMLEKNYRSHQNILDVAYASVKNNTHRANSEKFLTAQKGEFLARIPGKIERLEFSSHYAEIAFLAQKIQEKISEGIPATKIAILVRKNFEIMELARELPKFGIPVSAQISQNIFENESVRQLVLMLEVFSNPKYDEKIFDLLHSAFLQIDPHVLLELSLKRQETKKNLLETLEVLEKKDEKLTNFTEFLLRTRRDFYHCRPAVLAEKFLYESDLATFLTQKNKWEDWQNIRKFIDWIREQNVENLAKILDHINLHRDLGIPVRPDALPRDKRSVRIMTAHKSKGLEFEVVFIPGLEDKKWGNPRAFSGVPLPQIFSENQEVCCFSEAQDANEEERRLFFVALTRAKSEIFLTCSNTDFSGRAKTPSLFWHEIPKNLVHDPETNPIEEKLQTLLPIFFQHQEKTLTEGEKDILKEKVQNFVWSASSLQTFLDCPRKFLYQNLYRFPRRPLPQLGLGVALHQALEKFFAMVLQKNEVSKKTLLDQYEYALSGQNLPFEKFEEFLDHGKKILELYYDQKFQNFSEIYPFGYELEYDFGKFSPEVNETRITGKMDKIVFLDEKRSQVKIVDYKSGKPKTINSGDVYWRQLVFYDLLAKNAKNLNWQVSECEIEFLTPDPNGKLKTQNLIVSEQDRQQVIEEIKNADKRLKNLEFPFVQNPEHDPEIDYWQNFGKSVF